MKSQSVRAQELIAAAAAGFRGAFVNPADWFHHGARKDWVDDPERVKAAQAKRARRAAKRNHSGTEPWDGVK